MTDQKRRQTSSIEKLPPDILEKLHELLRDPRVTQLDATRRINEVLADNGHEERVSKSSLNRYSQRMEQAGERLRHSRQVAEMWIAKLGSQPQGQLGHLVNEMLRTLAFESTLKLQEGILTEEDLPGVIDNLKHLSLAMQRLEKATSDNVKREQELRKQLAAEAAEKAETTLVSQGISADSIAQIKRDILGIA